MFIHYPCIMCTSALVFVASSAAKSNTAIQHCLFLIVFPVSPRKVVTSCVILWPSPAILAEIKMTWISYVYRLQTKWPIASMQCIMASRSRDGLQCVWESLNQKSFYLDLYSVWIQYVYCTHCLVWVSKEHEEVGVNFLQCHSVLL